MLLLGVQTLFCTNGSTITNVPLNLEKNFPCMCLSTIYIIIAVCIYRLVMMSIDLSKTFTLHVQMVTGSTDVIVTQLLRYHMPLLYCMQPFNITG